MILCVLMIFATALTVGAAGNIKYGLNDGILWYSGYKGAYCHFYTDEGPHFAKVGVKSEGSWIRASKQVKKGQWAKADTGLQKKVTDWDYNYGFVD